MSTAAATTGKAKFDVSALAPLLVPVIIVIIAIIVLPKLLNMFGSAGKTIGQDLGLTGSDAANKAKAQATSVVDKVNTSGANDYFNPAYYKTKSQTILQPEDARAKAIIIKDAIGWFYNNQSDIVGVFKALQNRSQVSQVAEAFTKEFTSDLLSFLNDHLLNGNTNEDKISMSEILTYTENLS